MSDSPGSDPFTLVFTLIDETERAGLSKSLDPSGRREGFSSAAIVGATPASPAVQEMLPAAPETSPALQNQATSHLESLAEYILRVEGASGAWDITVALVGEARLQQLHAEFMGIDTATDIMTFPTEAGPGTARGGDLVISMDHVQDWSLETGSAPEDELRFLIAHGLLHLLGWRDETDRERQSMLARQQEIINAWKMECFDPTVRLIEARECFAGDLGSD